MTWSSRFSIHEREHSPCQDVANARFAHVTYTEAVDMLLKAKKKFEFPVKWGADLQSEHERYLTEVAFKGQPVIVTDYPKVSSARVAI